MWRRFGLQSPVVAFYVTLYVRRPESYNALHDWSSITFVPKRAQQPLGRSTIANKRLNYLREACVNCCTNNTKQTDCQSAWENVLQQSHLGKKSKGKGFTYSLPSVWPGADPGVQAVSQQVTISHPPSGWLPLFCARPAVTFPALELHRP